MKLVFMSGKYHKICHTMATCSLMLTLLSQYYYSYLSGHVFLTKKTGLIEYIYVQIIEEMGLVKSSGGTKF